MIETLRGDLAKFKEADVVVSGHNGVFMGGSIATTAIMQAGGVPLFMECRKCGMVDPGHVLVTEGYDLPCKHIIHVAIPYFNGTDECEKKLAMCYENTLKAAVENGFRTIAFPAMGATTMGFAYEKAAEVGVPVVKNFLENNPGVIDKIYWVFYKDDGKKAFDTELSK